jgi:hypothetical protein
MHRFSGPVLLKIGLTEHLSRLQVMTAWGHGAGTCEVRLVLLMRSEITGSPSHK